jgi:hypothetical protein
MTGTKDDMPIGTSKAAERRVPYDHIILSDQYLLTFEGGDHMTFAGRIPVVGGGEKGEEFRGLVLMSSTAFWDAYLKGDAKAKAWLTNGFEKALKEDGKFEMKTGKGGAGVVK